jgi:hypothetical protein
MRISILLMFLLAAMLPARALERVTVAQLEQRLAAQKPPAADKPMQALRDSQIAELIGDLVLTERLSYARLDRINQKLLPGQHGK